MTKTLISALKLIFILVTAKVEVYGKDNSPIVKLCEKLFIDNGRVLIMNFDSDTRFVDIEIIRKCTAFPLEMIQTEVEFNNVTLFDGSGIMAFREAKSILNYKIVYNYLLKIKMKLADLQVFFVFEQATVDDIKNLHWNLSQQLDFVSKKSLYQYFFG
jgi:hypothetical protein